MFEDQYRGYQSKVRMSYPLSLGVALSTWGLAYRYSLKFPGFLAMSLLALVGSNYGFRCYFNSSMISRLNDSAFDIAKKYPEIKFSRMEFTNSENVAPVKRV